MNHTAISDLIHRLSTIDSGQEGHDHGDPGTDQHHHHHHYTPHSSEHDHNDDSQTIDINNALIIAKGTAMIVLFSASTICGLIPFLLNRWFKWTKNDENARSKTVVKCLLYFGGGVLLCTTFLHLLPEVKENIGRLQSREILPKFQFHLAEFLMLMGFFTMFLIEELIHGYLHRHQKIFNNENSPQSAFKRGHSIRDSFLVKGGKTNKKSVDNTNNISTINKKISDNGNYNLNIQNNINVNTNVKDDDRKSIKSNKSASNDIIEIITSSKDSGLSIKELLTNDIENQKYVQQTGNNIGNNNPCAITSSTSSIPAAAAVTAAPPVLVVGAAVAPPAVPANGITQQQYTAPVPGPVGPVSTSEQNQNDNIQSSTGDKRRISSSYSISNKNHNKNHTHNTNNNNNNNNNNNCSSNHHHHHHHHHHHSHLPIGGGNAADEDMIVSSLRGLLIVLALSIHELFEGLAVGLESSPSDVWFLFGGVSAHKLILAFCVGVELIVSRTKFWLAICYVLTFAIVSPIGIGIGILITNEANTAAQIPSAILQGLATGTLLYVVFFEILSKERSGLVAYLAFIIGFFVMFGLQLAFLSLRYDVDYNNKDKSSWVTVDDIVNKKCNILKENSKLKKNSSSTKSIYKETNKDDLRNLLRRLTAVFALAVHAFFEGLILGLEDNFSSVWYLFLAIATHQFVITFCVGVELVTLNLKTVYIVIHIVILSNITPIGICVGALICNKEVLLLMMTEDKITTTITSTIPEEELSNGIDNSDTLLIIVALLRAISAGTLLYVFFVEILRRERDINRGRGFLHIFAIILGFCFMMGMRSLVTGEHDHGDDDGDHGHGHSHSAGKAANNAPIPCVPQPLSEEQLKFLHHLAREHFSNEGGPYSIL